jgi:hypothetical protein
MVTQKIDTNLDNCKDIPLPVVLLNRWTLVVGVVLTIVLQQPLISTALFAILLPATLFGQKGSLIFQVGTLVFARQCATAHTEDRRVQRFNNSIATILLGLAQIAFILGVTVLGYVFAGMVAVAAGVALAGFCVGCFLYFQFNLQRYRLFGSR